MDSQGAALYQNHGMTYRAELPTTPCTVPYRSRTNIVSRTVPALGMLSYVPTF